MIGALWLSSWIVGVESMGPVQLGLTEAEDSFVREDKGHAKEMLVPVRMGK